ncbi:interferon-inducible GTPase 5-like [Mytilus californianus]|uniref:interferon-inducible GTPase 5-like n=1 Tax=Mytilus californianus TaxID=6549 RepID=UPI0022452AD7|nr:interferon-inducible GTPase 5-like [Mytilus californianus]
MLQNQALEIQRRTLLHAYAHPRNEQIVLFDFPGVGTEDHSKSKYMTKVNASECDYFLIFFDSVISDDVIWLAERLKEINKPYCFVRSMIDQDIQNAEFDGKNLDTVLEEVRENVQTSVAANNITRDSSIFFISGRYTDIGEFPQLLTHMEKNISSLKFESILFSISAISKEVIEKKYQKLKSRIRILSVGAAAISAEPIPFIDLFININLLIYELHHYIDTFGITMDKIESLPAEVKERLNVWNILKKSGKALVVLITQQIGKAAAVAVVESVADFLIPMIGSLISAPTTYFIVKDFLRKYLDQMKEDAIIVYDNVLHAQKHLHTDVQVC